MEIFLFKMEWARLLHLRWVEDSCVRQPAHCFVRDGEGASYVSRLIDQTGFLQKLICHTSLLFLTQSSTFPKSFTPMGSFEFDKLHCLRGDKREQSDSYLSPETPWQPDMHLSRAAPGACREQRGNPRGLRML